LIVTLEEIRKAASEIGGKIVDTPCLNSPSLSKVTGAQVILKFENLQLTGSFKARGALVKLLSLTPDQKNGGVIAMSAGNHAQAVAYHARQLGISALIVMPRFTPNVKVEQTRSLGAEVILHGDGLDEAGEFAQTIADERNLHLVHPYDDKKVITGQGTIALEMLATHPDLEVLVVPIGGGGLIAGNAVAAKGIQPAIEIVGVEVVRFPSMLQALEGAQIKCGTSTLAEGIAVKEPGKLTMPIVQELVDHIVLVDEVDIEEALLLLLQKEKTVVEGAGAAVLAALLKNRDRFAKKKVGLILSGGNIDLMILSSIIKRGLVRTGRLIRLHVELRDIPGALAEVSKHIGDAGANIIEVHHQRTFTTLPLQSADVELVLQTRGRDHVEDIIDKLTNAGYKTELPDRSAIVQ
jgi:threonine dehydratase